MKAKKTLLIACFLALSAGISGCFLRDHAPPSDVPTMVVHPGSFVQRVTADGNLEAVKSVPLGAPMSGRQPFKIAWMVKDGARVHKGDVIVRFDATGFEEEKDKGQAELEITGCKISRALAEKDMTIADLDRDADLAREEAEAARTYRHTDDMIYSRNEIIESEIDTALAEKKARHAEEARKVEERLAQAGIELLEIEKEKIQLKIDQAEEGLQSLALTAPRDGIVTFKRDWRGNISHVGEQIWPGRPLASMPGMDRMQAVVFVLEADAGGLKEGQRAEVVLEAHPKRVFAATVESVDPVAQQRLRWIPVQYFRTVLKLEETVPELMKPGGRVHAEIYISEKENVISVPRQAVVDSEGTTSVFRFEKGRFVPVPVETGASAGGRILITSGLSDGDIIALRDPKADTAARPTAAVQSPLGDSR